MLNEITQNKRSFYVAKLPDYSTESTNPLAEASPRTPSARCPIKLLSGSTSPSGAASYDDRRRRIMDALAVGHRTKDVAEKFKMTQGRVSQLRREFQQDWTQFTADPIDREDN